MLVFLGLICYSIYAKLQGFRDECVFTIYGEIQDGRQKWWENNFGEKRPADSADILGDPLSLPPLP